MGCSGETSKNIIYALGIIGDPVAVEPLIRELQDRKVTSSSAAQALGYIGDKKAVESLIEALMDSDEWIRCSAAKALGMIGDDRAVEPLRNALKDSNELTREYATIALVKLGATNVPGLPEWIFEEINTDKDGQCLIKLVGSDILRLTGALCIVSLSGKKIDPKKEHIILSNPKIECGMCQNLFPLPDYEIKLGLRGFFKSPSAYICRCPYCESSIEVTGHTIESPDKDRENWILSIHNTIPSQYVGSPFLGWPRLTVDKVSVESLT